MDREGAKWNFWKNGGLSKIEKVLILDRVAVAIKNTNYIIFINQLIKFLNLDREGAKLILWKIGGLSKTEKVRFFNQVAVVILNTDYIIIIIQLYQYFILRGLNAYFSYDFRPMPHPMQNISKKSITKKATTQTPKQKTADCDRPFPPCSFGLFRFFTFCPRAPDRQTRKQPKTANQYK